MTLETILLLAVLVPTIGAFALPLVSGLSRRLRNGVAFGGRSCLGGVECSS